MCYLCECVGVLSKDVNVRTYHCERRVLLIGLFKFPCEKFGVIGVCESIVVVMQCRTFKATIQNGENVR